jgi:hypothetical protein
MACAGSQLRTVERQEYAQPQALSISRQYFVSLSANNRPHAAESSKLRDLPIVL